jgi:hypothetical protein
MKTQTSHPSDQILSAYALGTLDQTDAEKVFQHLPKRAIAPTSRREKTLPAAPPKPVALDRPPRKRFGHFKRFVKVIPRLLVGLLFLAAVASFAFFFATQSTPSSTTNGGTGHSK